MHEEYKSLEEIEFFTCKFPNELRNNGIIDCINWEPTAYYPFWCKIGFCNCIRANIKKIIKETKKKVIQTTLLINEGFNL